MANNDQIIGLILAFFAAIIMLLEFIVVILRPATDENILRDIPNAQYWGIAIPIFLGVLGVLGIVLWIGITMYRTPPPEAWDFEDFEEELEEDSEAE